ncbi:MAG: NAD-dependent epimerase/dehydratase family protein [Acidaminococcaceae bacterium]
MLLVTGITGHSGRYFLEELEKNDYKDKIRCIVRSTSDTSIIDKSGLNIEKVIGDITDKSFIDQCMIDVDTIVHIFNIKYTLNILEAALNNNISRLICVHTTGIYSQFKIASEEYKIIDEKIKDLIKDKDISLTILQPTMIFGDLCDHNMSKFIKMVDHLRIFPVINQGRCLIQPVNARDLGKAYYQVLMLPKDKAKTIYNLSGEIPIAMIDAFRLISNNLGRSTFFISCPDWLGVFLAKILKKATLGKIDYIEKVQRMTEDRCFEHEDAKIDFGYNPESFEIGIAREVKAYKNR